MIVKVKTVQGLIQIFETNDYTICKVKDMNLDILDLKVYAGNKCIVHKKRNFKWLYKNFLYVPEQQKLKPAEQNAPIR